MAIKALFPNGQNSITVSGLYQWDYGQELEIESADLGSIVAEVHFACSSMSEAIVRPCAFSSGAGTVTIPDECLEQSSTITAWIYEIAGTQGRTRKVLTIPVTARTRPSVGRDIPTEITDQYTELITEINEAIDDIENGVVNVKYAEEADTAKEATHAGNASTATHAISADEATHATNATNAQSATVLKDTDQNIDVVENTLAPGVTFVFSTTFHVKSTGIYVVVFETKSGYQTLSIAIVDLTKEARSASVECVPKSGTDADIAPAFLWYNPSISDTLHISHPKATMIEMLIVGVYKIAEI